MSEPLRVVVSAFQRTRMVTIRMVRGERRKLVIDLNAAVGASRTIVSATFRTNFPNSAFLSTAAIALKTVTVELLAQNGSISPLRCDVTLDDGTKLSQYVMVLIADGTWFEGEVAQPSGPRTLTVTA